MTRSIAANPALQPRTILVGGVERTYCLAGDPAPGAPLLVALHGLAMAPSHLDEWTGLAGRGPAAGFATVFPEGIGEMWDDTGRGRVDRVDDDSFMRSLVTELAGGDPPAPGVNGRSTTWETQQTPPPRVPLAT